MANFLVFLLPKISVIRVSYKRVQMALCSVLHSQTTLYCTLQGFKQANLAILPKRYADDFRRFCQGNAGACPLLYESKPGEWKAPPLCAESDVRSDVALYNKIKSGNVDGQDETLLGQLQCIKIFCFYRLLLVENIYN